MCVDYRRLNAVTIKDKYPLPLIEEQLDRLGGHQYFIVLDLASGFYQVPVASESVTKTAFVTPDHHLEFLRMPFGLSNAPAVFQRLMNNVLGELKGTVAFPYIDDIIIPCPNASEGLARLQQVLEALRQHKLTLKLNKCKFFQKNIDYLGREVTVDGIKPGSQKVEAVMEMKEPRNIKGVRQFLGLSGYFRRHVKNYSSITEPLTRLLRKDVRWNWGPEQQKAFDEIKKVLSTRPVLAVYDPELNTELHTDASALGFGAILFQMHQGVPRVVAYYSKQTTSDQRQYHSYELETAAVVLALRHFRVYLIGIKFTVVTDCSALRTAFSKKDLIPRVARWWLEVQDFNFDIKYRSGMKMPHVDALSRYNQDVYEVNQADLTEADWILAAQLQDEQLLRIRGILVSGERNQETKMYFDEYVLKNDRVYRKLKNGKILWAVPRAVRWQICRLCHDQAGHAGTENTITRIQENYWFAKMRRYVAKYIKACLNCSYYKQSSQKKQGKLHPIEKINVPYHTLHVDHVGPFETSSRGNKFILVIVDAFTKFVVIEPVKSQKTTPVVQAFQRLMCLFGVPTRIISDRGSAFTAHSFRQFCEAYGIKHVLNAVSTPRANGQCERYNKTILNALATISADTDSTEWDAHLKDVQSAINTTFNKGIKLTPAEALLGYKPRPLAEASLLAEVQAQFERLDLVEVRRKMKDHIAVNQAKQKEYYDRSRREADKYEKGELVLVLITSVKNTGTSKKLTPKYRGPFKIVTVMFNDRYEVEDLREGYRKARTVVAVDKIRRWSAAQE